MIAMAYRDLAMMEHRRRVERANAKGWLVQSAREAGAAAGGTRREAVARAATGLAAGLAGVVGVLVAVVVR